VGTRYHDGMSGEREVEWLRRIRDFAHALHVAASPAALPDRVLDAAIELTGAERGFLVRLDGGRVRVLRTRGFDTSLGSAPAAAVSRTAIERVVREDRGVVTTDVDDDLLGVTSVVERRIESLAAAPLRLRGATTGVLYLDHRSARGLFRPEDLPHLEAFAGQAALALAEPDGGAAAAGDPGAGAGVAGAGRDRLGRLVGRAPSMAALFEQVEKLALVADPVLVLGESGAGKTLVAEELHARGQTRRGPLVVQGCGALPDEGLEVELLGARRDAVPGARRERRGLLGRAAGGTLVLEGVADMGPRLQAALVDVLEAGSYRPVGGERAEPLTCRIVASAAAELAPLVEAGRLRLDLFYRLDVLRLVVPPLRERREDVLPLLERFFAVEGRPAPEVTPGARERLLRHGWPGNVRELRNLTRRWLALGEERVTERDLGALEARGGLADGGDLTGKTLPEVERSMVQAALASTNGNKTRAARKLGIPRSTLYGLIERYGLG